MGCAVLVLGNTKYFEWRNVFYGTYRTQGRPDFILGRGGELGGDWWALFLDVVCYSGKNLSISSIP